MASNKKYFHDHLVLLLLSVSAFMVFFSIVFIVLRLAGEHSSSYIVECRDCSNVGSSTRFISGGASDILAFIFMGLLTLVINVALSIKAYNIHRQFAVTILGLGLFLSALTVIVSNALLVLR